MAIIEVEKLRKVYGKTIAVDNISFEAVIGGAMIPLLTLAVPGSPPAAMFLVAIWLHGVQPGPMLPIENPSFLYQVAISLLLATCFMLIWGLIVAKPMATILKLKRERLDEIPLGRLATVTDVVNAALYLASDESSFLTGISLPVDGGLTAY